MTTDSLKPYSIHEGVWYKDLNGQPNHVETQKARLKLFEARDAALSAEARDALRHVFKRGWLPVVVCRWELRRIELTRSTQRR